MIKAILFDIDGVLVDSRELNYLYITKLFKLNGFKFISKKEYVNNYYHLTANEVIKKCIPGVTQETLEKINISRSKISYIHKKSDLAENEMRTLLLLKNKYKLGIVTGRTRRGVKEYMRVLGLKDIFAVTSCLENYLNPKPHPEPIIYALSSLGIKAEEALYVGDSYTDLLAAKAIGMKMVTFYGISGHIFKDADANIKTFAELPKTIEKLSNN